MVPRVVPPLRRTARRTGVRIAGLADLSSHPVPPPDFRRPFWPVEEVQLDGTRLAIRRTPSTSTDSEPALYIHGLGGASTNFTDLAAALAPWFDGEAMDLPGFGRSGPMPRGVYGPGSFARIVVRRIEQSGRGSVHLVGNSMGGAVAIVVAATRPDLVRTLTLISPAVPDLHPRRLADPRLPLLLVPGVSSAVQRRMRATPAERRVRSLLDFIYAHPEKVPDERIAASAAELIAHDEHPWTDAALKASMKGIVRWWLTPGPGSAWQLLSNVRMPTLVVWGEVDRLVDVSLAPRVARTIPDATLLVLPDVGHVAQMEEPTLTARAILALRERAAAARTQGGVAT